MGKVTFKTSRIDEISPQGYGKTLFVDCQMNDSEMLDALKSFLESVTDSTWCEWIKEISPEYLKDENSHFINEKTLNELAKPCWSFDHQSFDHVSFARSVLSIVSPDGTPK